MEVNNPYYVAGYGVFVLAMIASILLLTLSIAYALFIAAKNIHFDMIRNIFGSTLRLLAKMIQNN